MRLTVSNWNMHQSNVTKTVITSLPIALAIGVFGTIFGAMTTSLIGPGLTIAASFVIWSGVVQFTIVGLLLAQAAPTVILFTVAVINIRNLLLGAIIRPRLTTTPLRRALLGWFLIDETVGLALSAKDQAQSTLLVSGIVCYVSWILGTTIGVLGGSFAELRSVAESIFPVLFVGLSAIAATRRDLAIRAIAAGIITIVIAKLWPGNSGLAPALAALIVAYPRGKE